jgi:hypothetical protein
MAQYSHIFADFDEVSYFLELLFLKLFMIPWNLLDSTNAGRHLCILKHLFFLTGVLPRGISVYLIDVTIVTQVRVTC